MFIGDLFNTTLVLRKRHFTYRLIAVRGALLRAELRRKALISASLAEGLRRTLWSRARAHQPGTPAVFQQLPRSARDFRNRAICRLIYYLFAHRFWSYPNFLGTQRTALWTDHFVVRILFLTFWKEERSPAPPTACTMVAVCGYDVRQSHDSIVSAILHRTRNFEPARRQLLPFRAASCTYVYNFEIIVINSSRSQSSVFYLTYAKYRRRNL